jgi:hypothetical protein
MLQLLPPPNPLPSREGEQEFCNELTIKDLIWKNNPGISIMISSYPPASQDQ